jgi:hypothetical protein
MSLPNLFMSSTTQTVTPFSTLSSFISRFHSQHGRIHLPHRCPLQWPYRTVRNPVALCPWNRPTRISIQSNVSKDVTGVHLTRSAQRLHRTSYGHPAHPLPTVSRLSLLAALFSNNQSVNLPIHHPSVHPCHGGRCSLLHPLQFLPSTA